MRRYFAYFLLVTAVLWAGCFGKHANQCLGIIPEEHTCCGGKVVPNYQCCNTVEMTPDQICCGGRRVADLETEICCAGEVYPRATTECCEQTAAPRGSCSAGDWMEF